MLRYWPIHAPSTAPRVCQLAAQIYLWRYSSLPHVLSPEKTSPKVSRVAIRGELLFIEYLSCAAGKCIKPWARTCPSAWSSFQDHSHRIFVNTAPSMFWVRNKSRKIARVALRGELSFIEFLSCAAGNFIKPSARTCPSAWHNPSNDSMRTYINTPPFIFTAENLTSGWLILSSTVVKTLNIKARF